jgi:DNA polymerase I-like protein with 3'-5' exonuclease and polymerase domains
MKHLCIWTKIESSKTLDALAVVLKDHQDLAVSVCNDLEDLPYNPDYDVILALGKETLDLLGAHKIIAKGRSTTSMRNKKFEIPGGPLVMVSYSPGIMEMDYGHYVDLLCDTSQAVRLAKTGSIEPIYGLYEYVPDFERFLNEIDAMYAEKGVAIDCSLDLETIGFDPYLKPTMEHPGAYVVSIQLSHTVGTAQVVYLTGRNNEEQRFSDIGFALQMATILTSKKIKMKGANLKFDLHWLAVRGGWYCTNFVFDTTLVGSLLDENRSNGLDVHCKIYSPELGGYSDEFDKSIDKSRMDLVPKERLLPYAGGDADATLRVAAVQRSLLLQDPALTSFYVNILHPAARSFEKLEQGGVYVDRDEYAQLEVDLEMELASLVQKAKSIIGGRIVAKHADPDKMGGMNLTKASLLTDFMFSPMGLNLKPQMTTEKSGDPSTAMEHLEMFAEVPEAKEFIALLRDYASSSKTLSTYVRGFQKHLRSDGKYHPSYYFFAGNKEEGEGGTNTGRLSCRDPAFQTLPKHTKWAKRLRKCFIAPPGFVVMERDYSQGELKIVACVANEQTMLQAYRDGKDLHVVTAARFAGYTYDELLGMKKTDKDKFDGLRQLAKAGNFGLLYGMGAEGFLIYAVTNYGVKDLTLAQASEFRDGFMSTYSGLPVYHRTYKEFAKKNGYVRSPLGRIRHLPLITSRNQGIRSQAERQSINSPIQGTLSDLMLWTFALEDKAGLTEHCPAFGAIHDAAYNYVPEDEIDLYVPQHLHIMENLPMELVGWQPQLQFTADAKIGKDMANLKDWTGVRL